MRFSPFVFATLLVVSACHVPTNPCVGVAPPTLTLPRLIVNVGASLVPTVTGDADHLTFAVEGGGTLSPTEYVARSTPGTDRLRVLRSCAGSDWPARTELRVLAKRLAHHIARHAAVPRGVSAGSRS